MKLTNLLAPALVALPLMVSAPAMADTGDTGDSDESGATNELQTWKSSEGGCMSAAAPASAGLALLGLAFVARRRGD
ncbi:MAG: hypothetical protein VX265_04640 [Myxococcota bacterium]|nr:hypothetical protein [Myxococcota bacterium]MEC8424750.1 hypothetical protein [Myxococcota bacterium]